MASVLRSQNLHTKVDTQQGSSEGRDTSPSCASACEELPCSFEAGHPGAVIYVNSTMLDARVRAMLT
eukprot:4679489-Pleurochrysis_carterae.AAC.1